MQAEINLQVSPEEASNAEFIKSKAASVTGISQSDITHVEVIKRSVDARQRSIKINLRLIIYSGEEFREKEITHNYRDVSDKEHVVIIGAGPAGLFAALRLIELGIKPIILERGKDVRSRRRDLVNITRNNIVNEDSNYCFGEGGAGTYSDGKLYTRSTKRGDVERILDIFISNGASKDIKIEAHPHIGTNKLPDIVLSMREKIQLYGGEIHFDSRVTDLMIQDKHISGVKTADGKIFNSRKVILATGHSARDIFELLHQKGILIEAKAFALGVRIEHSQEVIDSIQYKCKSRGPYLPPAPYSISRQVNGRGVYSFCMCPGGVIAPCATRQDEIVTNGWSPSQRDRSTSNSGIVVELRLEDFDGFREMGPLAGLEFQKAIEHKAWLMGEKSQKAPAQRLMDFIGKRISENIPPTSYRPGTVSSDLGELLPDFISESLREGFTLFGKAMPGYLTNDAVIHAPESRSSSPVRIPRDRYTLEHVEISGLYPCGEGAGYAGGIMSAAIDGEKCAEKCAETLR